MRETHIKEDFRFRRVGSGVLIAIGLPLTFVTTFLGLSGGFGVAQILFLLPAPILLLSGLWGAFPMRDPKTRLLITDTEITLPARGGAAQGQSLALSRLTQIQRKRPIYTKHDRLTFYGEDKEIGFDVIHMTHEAQDIINLVGVRLEKQNKHLVQGLTEVMGAQNGIWEVRAGVPFEVTVSSDRMEHGTK